MYDVGGLQQENGNVSPRNGVTEDSLDGRKRSTEKTMYSREPEDQNSSLSGAENSHHVVMGWHTVHTVPNSCF